MRMKWGPSSWFQKICINHSKHVTRIIGNLQVKDDKQSLQLMSLFRIISR